MPDDAQYAALCEQARDCGGFVTLAQAGDAGVSHSEVATLVRRGTWLKVGPGLRRIADCAADESWPDRVRAAQLIAGPGAVVAGHTAARLIGIAGSPATAPIWLALPPERHPERRPGVRIMRTPVAVVDRVEVDGIVATATVRTILDSARYAAQLPAVCLIESCVRQELATLGQLHESVAALRGKRGSVKARAAMKRIDLRSESPLETKARLLLLDAGFRYPRLQQPVAPGDSRRIDLAYLAPPRSTYVGLAIEIDGRSVHAKAEAFYQDPIRHTELEEVGWLVRRFTDRHLSDAAYVRRTVRRALERAGCE
jgi:very-short-patch-repair endonuclease